MKKIKTALIGFGMSGQQFHGPTIINNAKYELVYVMTNSEKNIEILKRNYKDVKIIKTYDEALNDKSIDLIILATPNKVHDEYTYKALMNNKHVVVEKPFVETYKRARELYDLAKAKNLVLKVFHNRKYDGDIITLKELLETKAFGELVSASFRYDRIRPELGENWRFQENIMAGLYYDIAPHLVHHAISLFGVPKSVESNLYVERDKAITDDHFEMILNYDNDFKVFIGAEMLQRDLVPKLKVIGKNKTYVKYDFDNPDSINYPNEALYQTTKLKSELIDNNLNIKEIPLYNGKQYLFYENLSYDILNNISINNEDTNLALNVVLVMEKGLDANNKKMRILIPQIK